MLNKKPAQRHSAGIILYDMSAEVPRVLLLHYAAGHWEFPKGHTEKGEALQETALRELYEETGFRVTIVQNFRYQYQYYVQYPGLPKQLKEVTLFVGIFTTPSKPVKLSHEHQDYAWLTFEEAYRRLTYQNAKKALIASKRWMVKKNSF